MDRHYNKAVAVIAVAVAAIGAALAEGGAGAQSGLNPKACPSLENKVPTDVIASALANPSSVLGWGMPSNPSLPPSRYNPYRTWLTLQRPSTPYHPLFNSVEFKAGCPGGLGGVPTPTPALPNLNTWFNHTTCEFSKRPNIDPQLAASLKRFCEDPRPVTETVMVFQKDMATNSVVAECDGRDLDACIILADACVKLGGRGWCDVDGKCYCVY